MPRRTRLPVRASNRSVSMKNWKISKPISASSTNASATVIRMLRPKKSATPSSVWATTAACCCRPSTNTLQGSSNVWAKTAPIRAMTITANCLFPRIRIPCKRYSFQRAEAGFHRKVCGLPLLGTRDAFRDDPFDYQETEADDLHGV